MPKILLLDEALSALADLVAVLQDGFVLEAAVTVNGAQEQNNEVVSRAIFAFSFIGLRIIDRTAQTATLASNRNRQIEPAVNDGVLLLGIER